MPTLPFQAEHVDKETDEAIKRDFKGYTRGVKIWKPFNLCMPVEYKNYAEKIYNMEVRPNDVWIVTYPKTGTTWTQAAIWSVLNNGKLELLENDPMSNQWRFLEVGVIGRDGIDRLRAMNVIPDHAMPMVNEAISEYEKALEDPRDEARLIKSHLPFPFLPPNLLDTAKVVYIVRNPKDTCVSWYHHHKLIRVHDFDKDFATFFEYFIKDLVAWSPYWPHVIDAWNRRKHPNMLFLFYEDMKKDFRGALRQLADFLQKPITEELVEKLVVELSVEGMRKSPALNVEQGKEFGVLKQDGNFVRKGIVGDWKNHFTPEMERRMDEWTKKHTQGCDIRFPRFASPSSKM